MGQVGSGQVGSGRVGSGRGSLLRLLFCGLDLVVSASLYVGLDRGVKENGHTTNYD